MTGPYLCKPFKEEREVTPDLTLSRGLTVATQLHPFLWLLLMNETAEFVKKIGMNSEAPEAVLATTGVREEQFFLDNIMPETPIK